MQITLVHAGIYQMFTFVYNRSVQISGLKFKTSTVAYCIERHHNCVTWQVYTGDERLPDVRYQIYTSASGVFENNGKCAGEETEVRGAASSVLRLLTSRTLRRLQQDIES